jgi:hypothetical protein
MYITPSTSLQIAVLTASSKAICKRMDNLNSACKSEPWSALMNKAELGGQRPKWQDWVFSESKRRYEPSLVSDYWGTNSERTVIVFRIISFLFNIDVNLPCPPLQDYAMAPVPASKLLWRAKTEIEWEEQWEKENAIHGILRNGELVKLKNGVEEEHRRHAEWDRWYAGTDELGILAVLAADFWY